MTDVASQDPKRSLFLRITIWFTSTWLGQRIYVRVVPRVEGHLMWWSRGNITISPVGDPAGVGGLALLSTIGAKSGKLRHTALGFTRDGDALVVIASNAARAYHPAWYFNLKKNPEVIFTIPTRGRARYLAEEIPDGPERERLWRLLLIMNPGFERYTTRTEGRLMPIIRFTALEAQKL